MKNMNIKKAKYRINKPIRGYKKGEIVIIKVDKEGIPLEQYWRNRIYDAKIDNCISKVEEEVTKRKYQKKQITTIEEE